VFCPQCGFQNQSTANFCEKCGGHLSAAAADAPPHAHAAGAPIHMPKNPLSIAQMMLGLCVLLAVVIPAAGFYQWFVRGFGDTYGMVIAGQFSQLLNNSNSNGGSDIGKQFLQLFTLRIALESPLLIWSVYCGVMLWQKKAGALGLAKKFLLTLVVFLVCSHLVFPHFFSLSESYDTTLAVEFWLIVVLLAACYYLLLVSKQVRDYYEAPLAPAEASKPA
jgi:zinc-ribbon domain